MTPDPNTSAKVSRYKWEAYRDTNWWCIYYFLPRGGHTFAKVCHRNGRCVAILFKCIGVRGRFDSPDFWESRGKRVKNPKPSFIPRLLRNGLSRLLGGGGGGPNLAVSYGLFMASMVRTVLVVVPA